MTDQRIHILRMVDTMQSELATVAPVSADAMEKQLAVIEALEALRKAILVAKWP